MGPVFENVSTAVPVGGALLVRGPAGSGRTSLLLALSGRMRFVSGAVRVGPHLLPAESAAVRGLVAIARANPACFLEERLRVADLVAERCWIDRVPESAVRASLERLELDLPGKALVDELDPAAATLLSLALATAREPGAVVVDEPDAGCGPAGRARVLDGLARVRQAGTTVLTSGTGPGEHFADAEVVELPQRSAERLAESGRDRGAENGDGRTGDGETGAE